MLKSLQLHQFKSFEDAEIIFSPKVNIITGWNKDNNSGNEAGKSAIIEGLILADYGVSNVNLNKLPKRGKKSCYAQSSLEIQGKKWDIRREIPSKLSLKVDDKESNAIGINMKQNLINDLIGTYDFFQKFRILDNSKDINILKYTPGKFKKTLMGFLDNLFDDIRQKLLDQKRERETYNVDKKVYTHYYSDKRLQILKEGLEQIDMDVDCLNDEKRGIDKEHSDLNSQTSYGKRIIRLCEQEIQKLNKGKCPTCGAELDEIKKREIKGTKEKEIHKHSLDVQRFDKEIKEVYEQLQKFRKKLESISDDKWKIQKLITKLESVFKFKDYKFTEQDVLLYKEAIKVLDNFAAYYINVWVKDLETIINSLVYEMDMNIKFEVEKGDVKLKIDRNDKTFDYEELSSGAKIFLSCIFKIAILLQKGETTGLLIVDEGIDCLDPINIKRLISIIEKTNFQLILISQHKEIKELTQYNIINVIKENGTSEIAK